MSQPPCPQPPPYPRPPGRGDDVVSKILLILGILAIAGGVLAAGFALVFSIVPSGSTVTITVGNQTRQYQPGDPGYDDALRMLRRMGTAIGGVLSVVALLGGGVLLIVRAYRNRRVAPEPPQPYPRC
jgi:hypothetical protein